ncbi:hypothetical protein HYQ46_004987 [Verticillium longisporum]|nr:hypothetical protein HYQ46_004987 [Verticillium longisporum]
MSLGDSLFFCDISASVRVRSTMDSRPSSAEMKEMLRWRGSVRAKSPRAGDSRTSSAWGMETVRDGW